MEKTQRTNLLNYDLMRSNRFNRNERALLSILVTYSQHCSVSQGQLADWLCCSISTVQRTIRSLIAKGMIRKTYTLFKRCVLKLVSLDAQRELMSAGGIIKQVFKSATRQRKKYDRSQLPQPDLSPKTEPTRKETQEIKLGKSELFFGQKMPNAGRRMNEREFSNARSAQLAAFAEKFGLSI